MDTRSKAWLIFTGICLLLGFMLAILYTSTGEVRENEPRGLNDLRIQLQKERERTDILVAEIKKYTDLLYHYDMTSALEGDSDPLDVMEKERHRLRKILGLEEMSGEGFVIHLYPHSATRETTGYESMLYDEDLRLIVNELYAYGAKAIAINGERLIVNSAIRNVDDRILINMRPVTSPFEIQVLGDPDILIPALKLAGLEEYFDMINFHVVFEEAERLVLPAFRDDLKLNYLKPIQEEDVK